MNLEHLERDYKVDIRSWLHVLHYYLNFTSALEEGKAKAPPAKPHAKKVGASPYRNKRKVTGKQKVLALVSPETHVVVKHKRTPASPPEHANLDPVVDIQGMQSRMMKHKERQEVEFVVFLEKFSQLEAKNRSSGERWWQRFKEKMKAQVVSA